MARSYSWGRLRGSKYFSTIPLNSRKYTHKDPGIKFTCINYMKECKRLKSSIQLKSIFVNLGCNKRVHGIKLEKVLC
jgi:hypothetical protein